MNTLEYLLNKPPRLNFEELVQTKRTFKEQIEYLLEQDFLDYMAWAGLDETFRYGPFWEQIQGQLDLWFKLEARGEK